jgi:cytochrome c-type biogenesis protein CcmH/NrfG
MEDVVNTDPSNLNAKWYLAAMYEEFGRVDEAITLIEDLAGRFPDNTTVQQRLEGLWQAKNVGSTNVGLPEPVIEPIRNATDGNPVSN